MKPNLELKLQAWLDGELSESEARRISQEVSRDVEANRLVTDLQSIKSALAGNETPRTIPETREFYWSKIQRQIQREAQPAGAVHSPRRANWLRWLSPLAGFSAMACLLLMAVRPFTAPTFDDISSTGEGMEAVTFHDQTAGMTVVWLAETMPAQPLESPDAKSQDLGDSEVEME